MADPLDLEAIEARRDSECAAILTDYWREQVTLLVTEVKRLTAERDGWRDDVVYLRALLESE